MNTSAPLAPRLRAIETPLEARLAFTTNSYRDMVNEAEISAIIDIFINMCSEPMTEEIRLKLYFNMERLIYLRS